MERGVCPAGAVDARGAQPGEIRGRGFVVTLERVGEGLFCMIAVCGRRLERARVAEPRGFLLYPPVHWVREFNNLRSCALCTLIIPS